MHVIHGMSLKSISLHFIVFSAFRYLAGDMSSFGLQSMNICSL